MNPDPDLDTRVDRGVLSRFLMQVMWPGFVGAMMLAGMVFSQVDPDNMSIVQKYMGGSREAAYTLGFIGFWVICCLACGTTWYLAATERDSSKQH